MEQQEVLETPLAFEPQTKKYSSTIRLWHWLNAVIIAGSLLTVLINSTILKPWTNADLIADQLKENGVEASKEQVRPVAFALSDQAWTVHTWLGYALALLFIFRLVIEFLSLSNQPLIRQIRDAKNSLLSKRQHWVTARNEIFVNTLYALFYVLLMVVVLSGLALALGKNIPLIRSMHFIREIHGFTMYLIIGFIIVHLAGVFLGERGRHKGIISDMINGGKSAI